MDTLTRGFGYLATGLIAATGDLVDIPAIVQAGALGVVILMVALGYRTSNAERAHRATMDAAHRAHEEKVHKMNLEAIQRAYERDGKD